VFDFQRGRNPGSDRATREQYLQELVAHATNTKGDGTAFFDFIDHEVARTRFFDYFRDRILDTYPYPNEPNGIVTSGKFGWAYSAYAFSRPVLPKVWNFPGNLRHDYLQDSMTDPGIAGKRFVFIDNSIYKGRTLNQINEYIRRWGGQIIFAHVVYDGSRPDTFGQHEWTKMGFPHDYLYRWHEGGFKA
jgi:hypothetical protein